MGAVYDPVAIERPPTDPGSVLTSHRLTIRDQEAIYHEVARSRGPSAHFYAANGFPSACYSPLLSILKHHFSLTSLANRALWPGAEPTPGLRCRDYADDLIAFLEHRYTQPIIGIGHSMGATTTLMAAAKRPELFRRLILIEPVIQSMKGEWLTRLLPANVARRFEPIRSALAAEDRWDSLEDAVAELRDRRAFRRLDDEPLRALVRGLTESDKDGVHLAFPRQWEVHNYLTLDTIWRDLRSVRMPVRVIRGKPSMFLSPQAWERLRQRMPQWEFLEDRHFGHLLPMEAPERTAELIQEPPSVRRTTDPMLEVES